MPEPDRSTLPCPECGKVHPQLDLIEVNLKIDAFGILIFDYIGRNLAKITSDAFSLHARTGLAQGIFEESDLTRLLDNMIASGVDIQRELGIQLDARISIAAAEIADRNRNK